jgi:uncharacterized lipoprotein YddW (UPF0748 family)
VATSSLLTAFLCALPAQALRNSVGVLKSPDNAQQWTEITNRLQATGVGYCILETANWQSEADLNNINVLLLPNVTTLDGAQAEALAKWMDRGGRVIVTGPTGTLSQPEVRTQLRSLFGGYWGFANSMPATLQLSKDRQSWATQPELSSTLVGGVVIPTSVNSETAAVWISDGRPPAVIATDKSTFLGWRWGTDQVTSTQLDTAWLRVALNRFGINGSNLLAQVSRGAIARPCNAPPPAPKAPILFNGQQQSQQLPAQSSPQSLLAATPVDAALPVLPSDRQTESFRLSPDYPGEGGGLSSSQVTAMSQELESLIARFESTLLAAESSNSTAEILPKKVIDASEPDRHKLPGNTPEPSQRKSVRSRSYQAALEARQGLQQFYQLIDRGDYTQARQAWLKARRTLWDNYPTDRPFAQPEIRAMWLDRGTIVQARSEEDLAKIFNRLAAAGINTVFFETVNASYPIYPSRIAPEQNPLTRGWDPLAAAVKLAHARGMELHAWTWIFAAANQRHNEILGQDRNYLGPVLSRHPDWAMTDRGGSFFDRGVQYRKAFLDPSNPEVRRYLLALLEEIATQYDVDGIHLDYIRYPFQDPKINQIFGYSNSSRWQFKQMTGVDPVDISPSHPLWSQWTGFRIRQVDSFVAEASQRLKQQRPDLIVSAAVFPLPYRDRLFRLQQNWEEWGRNGWVDMIVLMTYALDTGTLEEKTQPLFENAIAGSALLVPGLRLLKVPDPVTVDQMQYIRNMPTGGYALFAAENLTSDLEAVFNRTQGGVSAQQPQVLPYRQPFKATASRYQALQREWNFFSANHQLALDALSLSEWNRQADSLATALNQLADNPSQQSYTAAQAALGSFRRQFATWMRQQKTVQPYQVAVWENRLETLARLLSYGEARLLQPNRRYSLSSYLVPSHLSPLEK